MTTSAVNMFRLRPGVTPEDFERFSVELDRPRCLAFDVVLEYEVFLTEGDGADVDVVEFEGRGVRGGHAVPPVSPATMVSVSCRRRSR